MQFISICFPYFPGKLIEYEKFRVPGWWRLVVGTFPCTGRSLKSPTPSGNSAWNAQGPPPRRPAAQNEGLEIPFLNKHTPLWVCVWRGRGLEGQSRGEGAFSHESVTLYHLLHRACYLLGLSPLRLCVQEVLFWVLAFLTGKDMHWVWAGQVAPGLTAKWWIKCKPSGFVLKCNAAVTTSSPWMEYIWLLL